METLTKLINKIYVVKKDKVIFIKEFLQFKDTEIFGGWENQYIAYNRKKLIFVIYERISLNDFKRLDIYFNEFAEIQIEEFLELYDTFQGDKDIEKFITLHFHKTITINKRRLILWKKLK